MRRFPLDLRPLALAAALLPVAVPLGCGGGGETEEGATEGTSAPKPSPRGEVIGEVETIAGPVSADGEEDGGGLSIAHTEAKGPGCDEADCTWSAASPGAKIGLGTELKTDDITRARVVLEDGTSLALDTGTTLRIASARSFFVRKGAVFADVSPAGADRPEAIFASDDGEAVVKGTKLVFAARELLASVIVSRGEVELRTKRGSATVAAGMEGTSKRDQVPHVAPAKDLAYVTEWARSLEHVVSLDGDAPPRGIGTLRANAPGSKKEKPLSLARHDVKVTIRGAVARTEVVEEFANPSPAVMEGTYEFPLPPGATITRLALWIGDRVEDGEIVETARAERIFKAIVEDSITPRDPALLKWKSGSTFSMKIFPIPAKGSRKVLIEYSEVLAARYDRYKYVYPLARAGGDRVGEFSLNVDVDAGGALAELATPRWPAAVTRTTTGATATFSAKDFAPRADFAFEYALAAKAPEATISTYLGKDGGRYFLARLRPDVGGKHTSEPRDYVFIVDTSHGVAPDAYKAEVATVAAFLAEMDERDHFKVLACDFACRPYADDFRGPTMKEIEDVTAFLDGLATGGSSDLDGAFKAAGKAAEGTKVPRIVYVGDGVATTGAMRPDTLIARIAAHVASLENARIDVVGVGADMDRLVLEEIARRFDGAVRFVESGGDEVRAALEIVAAQYMPALASAEVTVTPAKSASAAAILPTAGFHDGSRAWKEMPVERPATGPAAGPRPPGMRMPTRVMPRPSIVLAVPAVDVFPRMLPTIHEGDEVLVVGRFSGEGDAEVLLEGTVGGEKWTKRWPVKLTAVATKGNAFIPALWGRAKIDSLTLQDPIALKDEIVKTSFDTSVMSRYTSFLVLENEKMYREFKVARKTDRDTWTGDDAPVTATATAEDSSKAGDATKDEKSAAEPLRDDVDARDTDKPAAGATSATSPLGGLGLDGTGAGGGGAGKAPEGRRGVAGATGVPSAGEGDESTVGSMTGAEKKESAAHSKSKAKTDDPADREVGGEDLEEEMKAVPVTKAPPPAKPPAGPAKKVSIASDPKPMPDAAAPRPAGSVDDMKKAKEMPDMEPEMPTTPVLTPKDPMPLKPGMGMGPSIRDYDVPVKVATVAGPPARTDSDAIRASLAALQGKVDAEPSVRAHREALVKRLVKLGRYDDARKAAEAWLAADADSPLPLEYLGDLALQAGDLARAVRLYDSLSELSPQDKKLHERLARMHGAKGEAAAGCSHLRAALELDGPPPPTDALWYRRSDGLTDRGDRIGAAPGLGGAAATALARCEDGSAAAAAATKAKKAAGELAVELTWTGAVDLDLSIVPPKADRLGVLKSLRGLSVRDARAGGAEAERLVARELGTGTYLVMASAAGGALATPVSGTITVKARGTVKKMSFTIPAGSASAELAAVKASVLHVGRWSKAAGPSGIIYK